jgi:transcriptional regulator with XRE-family HTH domain
MMSMEKESQRQILENFEEKKQQSTDLNSKKSLTNRLDSGKESRGRFVSSHVDKGYAFQIRAMREARQWSQTDLARMVDMNQNAISRLESPYYGKATLSTLKRIAAAFDVGLVVRFVPFTKLINWVSGTAYVENGLSTDALIVPAYEEEKKLARFEQPFFDQGATATIVTSPNQPIFTFRVNDSMRGVSQVGSEINEGVGVVGQSSTGITQMFL